MTWIPWQSDPMTKFAENLRARAKALGSSHAAITELAGVTPRALSHRPSAFWHARTRAQVTLERMSRPDWAQTLSRDRYGLYGEIEVEDVTQRLRWIPLRTFIMGSPDDEPGRSNIAQNIICGGPH